MALNILQLLIFHNTQPNPNHIYLIYVYKEDLASNNLQWLICHKTQPNHPSKANRTYWASKEKHISDTNYTRMLRALFNEFCEQHPTKQQLYGHLSPITQTIRIRQTRHTGNCWESKEEHINDVLLSTPKDGHIDVD